MKVVVGAGKRLGTSFRVVSAVRHVSCDVSKQQKASSLKLFPIPLGSYAATSSLAAGLTAIDNLSLTVTHIDTAISQPSPNLGVLPILSQLFAAAAGPVFYEWTH